MTAARRLRGGQTTDTRLTSDRRASVVCPPRSRRPSVIRPKKAFFRPDGWTAGAGRTNDTCAADADRHATDALRSSVYRASVALPSRLRRAAAAHPSSVRRLSAVQPPSIRHKAEISVVKTSSHRQHVVAMWSGRCLRCRRRRVHFAQSSQHRRMLVASSTHCRRTVVASLSHRRRVVAVSSSHSAGPLSHRRRAVVETSSCCQFPGRQDPSSYTRNHAPHVFRA